MKKCKSCGFESSGTYCPECGQEIDIKRLRVKTVLRDGTHKFLHWENPSLNTIRQLLIRPGVTAIDYISGIRKSLIKPYKFFLSMQTIHVLCYHWLSKNYFEYIKTGNTDTQTRKELTEIQNIISNNIKYFDYLIPAFFALFFFLLYKKKSKINYAESLASSFYWIGATLISSIIFMFFSYLDIRLWNVSILINICYLTFAIVQFSGKKNFKGILKGIFTVLLSYSVYLTVSISIILLYEFFH